MTVALAVVGNPLTGAAAPGGAVRNPSAVTAAAVTAVTAVQTRDGRMV
jgi:hypothetical protein